MDREEQILYQGEDYADLIVSYLNRPELLRQFNGKPIHYINEYYAIVYIPVSETSINMISNFGYSTVPMLFGLTSRISIQKSGIEQLRSMPDFNLRGQGVLIGIIDTGIDYTNPVFIKPDGTTKIAALWDQTINTGTTANNTLFGSEYLTSQINEALASSDPFSIVPSIDENGHGTMMAGVAAGNESLEENFEGVAPDSELVIVKLRQAKEYLRKFYVIPDGVTCFQENHIMWGVQYCVQIAQRLNKPIVICTGLGTAQGAHDGRSNLSTFMSTVGDFPNTAVVTSAGNEGNSKRHYNCTIDPTLGYNTVELNVGQDDKGFSMQLWGDAPGIYTLDITSPNGEHIPKLLPRIRDNQKFSFIFEDTIIYIDNLIAESLTGDQLILMRFQNVSPGIWRLNVYGQSNLATGFNIWLPMGNMISEQTYFINSTIYTTILAPGTSRTPITVTAYNPETQSLYTDASRGYTRNNIIKPELAAPGVDYIAPALNKEFQNFSGTGVAAAHTSGIAALIMEWGAVKRNQPNLSTMDVKNYLIRGASRQQNLIYPNRGWGYGIIDVFNTFNVFRFLFDESR